MRARSVLTSVGITVIAVVGLSLLAPSTAIADTVGTGGASDVQVVFAVPPTGWDYGHIDGATLILNPGEDPIPLWAYNNSPSDDFQFDTASAAACAGSVVPHADQPTSPNFIACPLTIDAVPGATGSITLTLSGHDVQTGITGSLEYSLPYRVIDDRPTVTASHGGTSIADGATVTAPLGSVWNITGDASVPATGDSVADTGATFVSPSPDDCLTVPATDIDNTHHITCTTSIEATQSATATTLAVSATSPYRSGALGQTSFSFQGTGGCTTAATVRDGAQQTITCSGFEPGITVTAVQHSTSTTVGGPVVVGPGGAFSFRFTETAEIGTHSVSIMAGSTPLFTTDPFTVGALAATGVDLSWQPFGAVGLALGAGVFLLVLARRRRIGARS
jgi:hypothetical protein